MKNRDLIKTLLDFEMDSDIIVLTKESDLKELNGESIPGIKFGSLGDQKDILVIVGDYNKFREEKATDSKEQG